VKKLIALFLISTFTLNFTLAQKNRASPKESTKGKIDQLDVTIVYGSPSVKGRVIWGELVPFDKIWRAGANEATTFEFSKDVEIENKKLPAGKYSFFVIPNMEKSTLIFNNDANQWGAYKYNIDKDQLRVDVKPSISSDQIEKLVYEIDQSNILLKWSNWGISFDVKAD
tara:strand:- start:1246 stop:1752 length:507 start_codon:yes stop_codon:yes gene_type:complete